MSDATDVTNPEPDYKAMAIALGERVRWALLYLDTKGSTGGMLMKRDEHGEPTEVQHWVHYFCDAFDMTGHVIDREKLMEQKYGKKKGKATKR